jgi:hypothetical protein
MLLTYGSILLLLLMELQSHYNNVRFSEFSSVGSIATVLPGAMPVPAQCPLRTTKINDILKAVEPYLIAISLRFSRKL